MIINRSVQTFSGSMKTFASVTRLYPAKTRRVSFSVLGLLE